MDKPPNSTCYFPIITSARIPERIERLLEKIEQASYQGSFAFEDIGEGHNGDRT